MTSPVEKIDPNEHENGTLNVWFNSTSFHGFIDYANAKETGRTIWKYAWIVIIIVAFGLAFWQITVSVIGFVKGPHYSTHVTTQHDVLSLFPNTTICNMNKFPKSKAVKEGLNPASLAFLSKVFKNRGLLKTSTYNYTQTALDAWTDYNESKTNFNIRDLVLSLGHTCEETFIACYWRGEYFDCCSRVSHIVSTFGLCYVINPPLMGRDSERGAPHQKLPGMSQGLVAIISSNLDEYDDDLVMESSLDRGITVQVSFNPKQMMGLETIQIAAGEHAWVSMIKGSLLFSKPQLKIFPLPCVSSSVLKIAAGKYTEGNCQADCYLQRQWNMCNCVTLTEVLDSKYRFCMPDEILNCEAAIDKSDDDLDADKQVFDSCLKSCLPACQRTHTVQTRVNSIQWRAEGKIPKIKENLKAHKPSLTENELSNSIYLDLFYPELTSVVIEHWETTTFITFIANIGGQLGLWIGASMLTMIQTCYYLCSCPGRPKHQ